MGLFSTRRFEKFTQTYIGFHYLALTLMTKRKTMVLDSYPVSWLNAFPLIHLLMATQIGRLGQRSHLLWILFWWEVYEQIKVLSKADSRRMKPGILICEILAFRAGRDICLLLFLSLFFFKMEIMLFIFNHTDYLGYQRLLKKCFGSYKKNITGGRRMW